MPQARWAEAVERPQLEAVAQERLQAAANLGCVFTPAVVACVPVRLLSLDGSHSGHNAVCYLTARGR